MARVIASRLCLSAGILLSACAPSVPHAPPVPRASPDATVDQRSTILEPEGDAASPPPRDATPRDPPAATPDAPIRETGGDTPRPVPDARDARSPDAKRPDADADADADAVPDADPDVVPPVPARPPRPGDLQITELLINPAGTDTNREWIELVNLTADALDLHLLAVADAASEVAVDAGVLAPGAILVLGQSLDPARNGGAPVGFSFGNTISLNNGGDAIRLCLGPCAGGAVIAEVSWTADLGAAFDGHAAVVGTVVGPDASDGGAGATVFCPAAQPFGGAGSFGGPGLPDPPCPG